MLKLKRRNLTTSALLSGALLAGCSDSDKNAGAGNPGDPLTPPTVLSVTPLNGVAGVCPNTIVISATFSEAMNPGGLAIDLHPRGA